MKAQKSQKNNRTNTPSLGLFDLLKPYWMIIGLIIILTILASGLNLIIPKIIANAIDTYMSSSFIMINLIIEFSIIAILIFIFTYLLNIV